MDYIFFNQNSSQQKRLLKIFSPVNKLFEKLRWQIEIVRKPYNSEMITIEQRINLFHMVNEILIHDIEGDVIELGCRDGNTALQIGAIVEHYKSTKQFHVYDAFKHNPNLEIKNNLIANFTSSNLNIPVIHEGFFAETLPSELPDKLSFIHIDCSMGDDDDQQEMLQNTIFYILENIYPRMSRHAVCMIMDYHDVKKTIGGSVSFPSIKRACDLFFTAKPEKMEVLYGNHFSHGYFRKK